MTNLNLNHKHAILMKILLKVVFLQSSLSPIFTKKIFQHIEVAVFVDGRLKKSIVSKSLGLTWHTKLKFSRRITDAQRHQLVLF